jgi:hypothetical protein
MKFIKRAFWFGLGLALVACGGGGDDPAPTQVVPVPTPVIPASPPSGLYVGYYQEDQATNPEDPVPGAFSLNLPSGDGSFSGSMFFTYVGCQTSNVGLVSGTKAGSSLSGNWSGTVDGTAQSGTYMGTYDPTALVYSGTYANAGGKQFRDLSPCIQYTIAPKGSWEMFAIESHSPATFNAAVNGRTILWGAVPGAAITLVYVLDPQIATSSGNPVVWQTVITTGVTTSVPSTMILQAGRQYIAAVGVLDASYRRLAFTSQRFTVP